VKPSSNLYDPLYHQKKEKRLSSQFKTEVINKHHQQYKITNKNTNKIMDKIQESIHHLNGDFETRQKNHQMNKMAKIKYI